MTLKKHAASFWNRITEKHLLSEKQHFRRFWWRVILSIRGTIWQYTLIRTFYLVCITIMLNLLDYYGYKIPAFKTPAHTLVGVALGLLLVYRTNAAYDRFWEGRKAWGSVNNNGRHLVRYLRTAERPLNLSPLAYLISAYAYGLKQRLRGEDIPSEYRMLNGRQVEFIEKSINKPLAISALITDWISKYCKTAKSRIVENYLFNLLEAQGALERIATCPIPLAYVAHVHHILLLYLITLPFCLLSDFGWYTSIAICMVSISLLGIDQAATHIEDPFGTDPSDLPLEALCKTISTNALWLSEHQDEIPDDLPSLLELDKNKTDSIDLTDILVSPASTTSTTTPTPTSTDAFASKAIDMPEFNTLEFV